MPKSKVKHASQRFFKKNENLFLYNSKSENFIMINSEYGIEFFLENTIDLIITSKV